jgi:hypothetical protein
MSDQVDSHVCQGAIELLRGRPNPFDSLVRPRFADDDFDDLHVDAVLRKQREKLLASIDSYRKKQYASLTDLPGSRVIAVLGARGAGKTHMLEAISRRTDGRRQLLIRRQSGYDGARCFEEHVTFEIARALLTQDPVHKTRPFLELAPALTRQLVARALCDLTATDRLWFARHPRRFPLFLPFGGTHALYEAFEEFQRDVDQRDACAIADAAKEHHVALDLLYRLVETHLGQQEQGQEPLSLIRHKLYLACARHTLQNDPAAFDEFLEGDFCFSPDAVARDEFIAQLRNALVEFCALFQRPVVLAYDNFEAILAPRGAFDQDAARAFASGLAQAIDAGPGVLFLLFIDYELFAQLKRAADSFANQRLEQGVVVPGCGALDRIELGAPTGNEVLELVRCRVAKVLDGLADPQRLPLHFPFSQVTVEELAGKKDQVVRLKLIVLRDKYADLVHGQPSDEAIAPPPERDVSPPRIDLAHRWKSALAAAAHELNLTHAERLHVGLGRLLQLAGYAPDEQCKLSEVKPVESFGDDPRYGITTLATLQRPPANSACPSSGIRLAISFLLARGSGRGQPEEMRQKLAVFDQDGVACDRLILLRQSGKRSEDCQNELPPATRERLQQSAYRDRVFCRGISAEDLRDLFALPAWLEGIEEVGNGSPGEQELGEFLRRNCRSLLRLLLIA